MTRLLLEHNDKTLTVGKGIVGVMKKESKAKNGEIFPEILVSEGMLAPFAAVNYIPMGTREQIG